MTRDATRALRSGNGPMARLDHPGRLHADRHGSLPRLRPRGPVVYHAAGTAIASRSGRDLAFRYLPGRVEVSRESWRSVIADTIGLLILVALVIAMSARG